LSSILSLSHIQFQYQAPLSGKAPVHVLHDISFSLEKGEKVGLIGSNGVGKSTLLKLIVGLLPLQEGTLTVDGMPLDQEHLPAIRRKTGYAFQDSESQLFMPTVESDVSFAARSAGLPTGEVKRRTAEALERVGLTRLAERQVYRLSGGQKKLAAIAGLLTLEPELLLMDEPSGALDPRNRRKLIEILRGLPCAQLIASHDMDFIWDTCDTVLLLSQGRLFKKGSAKEILQDQALLESCELELPLRLQKVE
jgi:cobalt/nickel transport system ATP-binding protein